MTLTGHQSEDTSIKNAGKRIPGWIVPGNKCMRISRYIGG